MNWIRVLVSASLGMQFLASLAQPNQINVSRNEAVIDYPESVTFYIEVDSDIVIESVEIEFGLDVLTCGESATRAIPEDFEEGSEVDLEWEWNFRRRGAVPPGTVVWWLWRITDADGNIVETERQELVFNDPNIDWKEFHSENLIIYYLAGDEDFAAYMTQSGEDALVTLRETAGVEIDQVVSGYVFPDSSSMQAATLFAPGWSGGIAFTDHYSVLMAVAPDQLVWGARVFAHELTHVAVGIYTFSCVVSIPTWVNEGLADYNEGPPDQNAAARLSNAVKANTLFSVRELSGIFSNDPDLARLSYAQSMSLVQYLVEEYGQEKMLALLNQFSMGVAEDKALTEVYGFDRDGLEDEWRAWIGAAPREISEEDVGPTPTRTPVPTFDLSGGQNAPDTPTPAESADTQPIEATATPAPTEAAVEEQETPQEETQEPDPPGIPIGIFVVLGVIMVAVAMMIAAEIKKNRDGE